MPFVVLSFCVLILLASGWICARWNWAETWQASIAAGASAGLLAGCLIYNFFGVFWFGVVGHAGILANAYSQVNEAQGTRIVVEALINTNRLIYINFVWCVLACVALGMLGGFASAMIDSQDRWGRSPRHPEGWLFRLPAYLLIFFGFVNLIITIAVMELLTDKLMNTLTQMNEMYGFALMESFDKTDFLQFNYLVGWSFMILPVGLIIGWFIRFLRHGGSLNLSSITGLATMVIALLAIMFFISPGIFTSWAVTSTFITSLLGAAVLAIWVGLMTRDEAEGFPYHTSDWVGYLFGYGILGSTQIIMGSVAFALPVTLIGIINIGHLVTGKIVDPAPVDQVSQYFGLQTGVAFGTILVSAVIALITVNLVSFFRSFFDIREIYLPREDKALELERKGDYQ